MAKIAVLYECLGRSKGGIEAWIYHVSEELINQGHQITLIKVDADTPSDSAPKGVNIMTLQSRKKIPVINLYFDIINRVKQLKNILFQYDIVWARSYIMAYSASRVLGKNKVIYINAAPYSLYGRVSFKDNLKNARRLYNYLTVVVYEVLIKAAYVLEKKAILDCKNVFLSKARMEETLTFFKINKTKVSCNVIVAGVNTNMFTPDKLSISHKCLKIISVSRLEKDKNIQCVLKAIKKLKDNDIPVKLTIAGVGSYENQLINVTEELNIKDLVFFVGRQNNIEEWYRLNNVFVLPSLYEGFGSVYIEAMASGLPCIAISNKSGKYFVAADEIIDPGRNGYLMTDDNPNELYLYLRKLYDNPDLLLELSRKAREKTINEFSWKKTVNKLLILN